MTSQRTLWLTLLLFSLWIAGCIMLFRDQKREKQVYIDKYIERSQDVGLTIEGLLMAMSRGPGAKKQMLQRTLSELVRIGQFESLALVNNDGELVLIAPEEKKVYLDAYRPGEIKFDEINNTLSVMTPLNLGRLVEDHRPPRHEEMPPELMRRLENWRKLKDSKREEDWMKEGGIHQFITVISYEEISNQLRQNGMLRLAIALASFGVIFAMLLTMSRQNRLYRLQLDLGRKDMLNRELQEKNLAAAGLAHETRTPLGVVRGLAQLQSEDSSLPPLSQDRASLMVEEVDRITSRLNDFIEYSRMREPVLKAMDLKTLFKKVESIVKFDLDDSGIRLLFPTDALPEIMGDCDMLQQVFFNLIHNAIQVCPKGSNIELRMITHKGTLDCILEDDGPGVPDDIQEQLFIPYVTRRPNGTGLGLAVVRQILQRHQVDIVYENVDTGGARFILSGFLLAGHDPTLNVVKS